MERQKPLSYQSSKSIFEHFTLNNRVSYLPRVPAFQQFHVTTPAKAGTLIFDWNGFTIDDFTHTFEIVQLPDEEAEDYWPVESLESFGEHREPENTDPANNLMVATPGTPLIYLKNQDKYRPERGSSSFTHYTILNADNEIERSMLLPGGILPSDATRKVLQKFLVGSHPLRVGKLVIDVRHGFIRVPTGLSIIPTILSIGQHGGDRLNAILPIIHQPSLPLNSIEVVIQNDKDSVFNNEIAMNAKKIRINFKRDIRGEYEKILPSINSHEILLGDELGWLEVTAHQCIWMSTPQPIGRRVIMMTPTPQYQMTSIRILFKSFIKFCRIPNKECPFARFALTTQVTDVSELNIYIYKAPNYEEEMAKRHLGKPWSLYWEIMELGTAVIMEDFVI